MNELIGHIASISRDVSPEASPIRQEYRYHRAGVINMNHIAFGKRNMNPEFQCIEQDLQLL